MLASVLTKEKQKRTDGSLGLSKIPSLASVSTRVNSSNSVTDLATEQGIASSEGVLGALQPQTAPNTWRRRLLWIAGLAALYAMWSRYVIRMSTRATPWGPRRLGRLFAAALTGVGWLAGVRGVRDIDERPFTVPDKQVFLCLHPHGVGGIGPLALLGDEPRRKNGKMENVFILAADICFKVPGLRELFLAINGRAATEQVIDDVLHTGGTVAVFPGGIHEQLATDPKQEKLFFPPNLGFIRQAIKHGVPLVPCYNFGENQQFGRWGIPFIPRMHPFQSRFGQQVDVGVAEPNPSDERVREIFLAYCAELRRLFNEFRDQALPPDVAARGLQLIWRGHEDEDLSAVAVSKLALKDTASVDDSQTPFVQALAAEQGHQPKHLANVRSRM